MTKFFISFIFVFALAIIFTNNVGAVDSLDSTIGKIGTPPGVAEQIAKSGVEPNEVAILFFLSSLIKVANVIAGIWVAFNVVFAAFDYLGGQGSAEAHKKVRERITMSVLGLLLLVVAYVATAMISLLLFGDASYVLQPKLE